MEFDGGQHAEMMASDADRARRLEAMGYRVMRFWNNGVLTNIEAVLGVILEALARAAPHPNPLSHGDYLRVARRGEGAIARRGFSSSPYGERTEVRGYSCGTPHRSNHGVFE